MAHRAKEITSYAFKSTDKLLLDTNVWFFVYGPSKPNDKRVTVYSRALDKMLKAKSRVYIDVLIVSEFVNRYARMTQNILQDKRRFKAFRQSEAFKGVAQDIADRVKRILRHCTRVESGFSTVDIDAVIDEYGMGNSDFNDDMLMNLCKRKGLKLVTDDGDFRSREIAILTANRRLLTQDV